MIHTANPLTAAITGFFMVDTLFQWAKKFPAKHCWKVWFCISLISAPAEKQKGLSWCTCRDLVHFLLKTWKNKSSHYQQMLSHCQWWRWLQHHCRPQSCPRPVPPPSSGHHTGRSEPWVGSAGWNPRSSPHLAFPLKCTHTGHLHAKKFTTNDRMTLRQRSVL